MKKSILTVLFFIVLSSVIFAQNQAADDLKLPAIFLPEIELSSLTPMAYNPQYPAGFGGKLGYGFLNSFFGLGSYLAGDWGWGIGLTLWQGLGFAGFIGFGWDKLKAGTFFNGYDQRWVNAGLGALSGLAVGPVMYIIGLLGSGIPDLEIVLWSSVGFAVLGTIIGFNGHYEPIDGSETSKALVFDWDMFSFSVWTAGIVFGIILPFITNSSSNNQPQSARLNDHRNWNIGLVPAADGRVSSQITFTAHF